MGIIHTSSYADMQEIYSRYFSLGHLNTDINTKFALISFICYLTSKIRKKKSNVTHYQIIKKIIGEEVPEDFIQGLAIVCSDFAYGCAQFPTFGLQDREIPRKVKEILSTWIPF